MLRDPCRSRTPPLSRAPPAFPHVSLVRCLCHIQHSCPARPDAHICSETVSSGAHRLGRSPGDPARRWSLGFTRPTAAALIMHMGKCNRVGDVDSRRLRCGSVKPQPRFPRLMSFEVRRRSCCRYWASCAGPRSTACALTGDVTRWVAAGQCRVSVRPPRSRQEKQPMRQPHTTQ